MKILLPLLTAALALPAQNLQVAGLQQAVTIRRDRWGVSHIYAASELPLSTLRSQRSRAGTASKAKMAAMKTGSAGLRMTPSTSAAGQLQKPR